MDLPVAGPAPLPRRPAPAGSSTRRIPYVLGLIFVVLAAGIITAGVFYYRHYAQHYRTEVERQISAIAELKADELAAWRKERLGDGAVFFRNAAFSALVRRHFHDPEDVEAREQIRTWLSQFQAAHQYDLVYLVDAQYSNKMIVPDAPERIISAISQRTSEILRSGEMAFEDFYRNEQDQRIYLKVLVPILEGESGSRLVAVVALRIDPETYIYPYLSRWPTPSLTAETLLVRRDGNDALFLNELRFRKDAALNLRAALEEEKNLLAVKAAMGQEGIVEGQDYRGLPAIAAVRAVPDSPWFLVARINTAEVNVPVTERLWLLVVFVGVLLLAAGAGVGFIWRQQSVRFYRERSKVAEALLESEEDLSITLHSIGDAVIATDTDGRVVRMNPVAEQLTGWPLTEAVGKPLAETFRIINAQTREPVSDPLATALATGKVGTLTSDTALIARDGTERQVADSAAPIRDAQGRIRGAVLVFHDITAKYEVKKGLEQVNRRLEELATTDELTGLVNRRGFMAAISLETERARRYGSDLALAMIDVDGFKPINDACGHAFGDRVLAGVARAIKEGARETDLVARYGGDEIIMLMPSTDAQAAVNALERIRRSIAGRVVSDGQRSLEVTISTGISALDSKDLAAGPEFLIRHADEAMYAAKHAGGNVTKTWNKFARDRTGKIPDESARVENLQRKVTSLSLQAKEMVVQSLGGLVHALEARDSYMKAHSANVTRYAVAIAETLELDPDETGVIRRAALIHDIGKIAVPDSILRKPGALDDQERPIMQGHVLAGTEIINQMRFLGREAPLVRHHHEWWNGGGYPDGISGEAIPLGASILAVADAFDAITADRVYHEARSVSQALQVLTEESGRQFAPDVVDAMVKWVRATGRELGNESDMVIADLLPAPAEAAAVVQ